MAMVFAKWNAPWDSMLVTDDKGNSYKKVFFILTFNSTSVGGISGTTYDPTNHYTTSIPLGATVVGSTIFDLWGARKVHQIRFSNGSSDANIQNATANSNTGECKGEFVEGADYVKLKVVGNGGDGTTTYPQDEAEIDTTAGNLSALRFTGWMLVS